MSRQRSFTLTFVALLMSVFFQSPCSARQDTEGKEHDSKVATDTNGLTMVVMDPLCDKLACDCVEGYAQRKYESLGQYLAESTGRQVNVYWGESINAALEETNATADIVIGKHSVVIAGAKALDVKLRPVACLTGSDGKTTQTGLIVVRKDDPAQTVSDLKGYRIFFGPEDCDEKYAAPRLLLSEAGIELPPEPEISGACSQAATQLMELDADIPAAAVISSYAEPLLSGCGTIDEGDLRIIGVSAEVPFVTAFLRTDLPEADRKQITEALLNATENEALLGALESAGGFVPYEQEEAAKKKSMTDQ